MRLAKQTKTQPRGCLPKHTPTAAVPWRVRACVPVHMHACMHACTNPYECTDVWLRAHIHMNTHAPNVDRVSTGADTRKRRNAAAPLAAASVGFVIDIGLDPIDKEATVDVGGQLVRAHNVVVVVPELFDGVEGVGGLEVVHRDVVQVPVLVRRPFHEEEPAHRCLHDQPRAQHATAGCTLRACTRTPSPHATLPAGSRAENHALARRDGGSWGS